MEACNTSQNIAATTDIKFPINLAYLTEYFNVISLRIDFQVLRMTINAVYSPGIY